MYIEYRVDLGSNIWKKRRKTHILGKFRGAVPVTIRAIPVSIVFCHWYSILTSVRILTITWSFMIRFE